MPPPHPSSQKRALLAAATSLLVYTTLLPSTHSQEFEYKFPPGFKLSDALNYYHVESASLLKRSLLAAGFDIDDTIEINETYLDFASRALAAEAKRIEQIRDVIKEQQEHCSVNPSSDQCVDTSSTSSSKSSSSESESESETDITSAKKQEEEVDPKLSPEFGHFLTPNLSPGQAQKLHWEDDGSLVQEYAARVGLPPQLVPTLKSYAEEMGLYDIMTNMLYDDPLSPGGSRFFTFTSPYQKKGDDENDNTDSISSSSDEIRNFTWNVERPEKKWKSDMHWFNTADELAHEDSLRALAKGGFDEVLDGIGKMFGLDHLHVDSLGFVAVTNCERGFIHTDWDEVDGKAFNFLVGIASPEDAGPELIVEGKRKGEVYYGTNAGVLVGDGTMHGTRECDHRANRGVRITCSIYLADLNENNLPIVAGDTTSIFPPTGDEDWIWSQRGRHWSKDGGRSLMGDLGRTEFEVEDEWDDCEEKAKEGKCIGDTVERMKCFKTCGVFIHDSVYKPGEERRKILGY